MLPDTKPPQDVIDLVNQYKKEPDKYELVIYNDLFLLYELKLEVGENGEPMKVRQGPFLKRAVWSGGLSSDMMRARLGIR